MVVGATFSRDDSGVSLVELSVVLALIGVIIAVSFGGIRVVYAGHSLSTRQAWFSAEIGQPLTNMERMLTQNIDLESSTGYSVSLLVDCPRPVGSSLEFDHIERHVISATTDGRVTEFVYSTDDFLNNVSLIRSAEWSSHNANQSAASAMFTFFDGAGAQVGVADAPTSARSVLVRIVTEYDGRPYEGTRTVFFRNR